MTPLALPPSVAIATSDLLFPEPEKNGGKEDQERDHSRKRQ